MLWKISDLKTHICEMGCNTARCHVHDIQLLTQTQSPMASTVFFSACDFYKFSNVKWYVAKTLKLPSISFT